MTYAVIGYTIMWLVEIFEKVHVLSGMMTTLMAGLKMAALNTAGQHDKLQNISETIDKAAQPIKP